MRHPLHTLNIALVMLSLPAWAQQPAPPASGTTHIIRIIRSGQGQPRVRDAAAARTASPRKVTQTERASRTRPYQVPKPGEGEPKS